MSAKNISGQVDSEQLKELLSKITPGEWILDGCLIISVENKEEYDGKEGIVVSDTNPETEYNRNPHFENLFHNATLISLAPSLAQRVIDLEEDNRVLREALEKADDILDGMNKSSYMESLDRKQIKAAINNTTK